MTAGLRRSVARHAAAGAVAAISWAVFWFTRLNWDAEMRMWRAVGDASLVLLLFSLAIGPLARLWAPAGRLNPWRREAGIWFALLAVVHTVLVLVGWVRWDWLRLVGFEFVPELGRYARLESGFGLANVVGLVALFLALVLAATSSDRALRALGGPAWKWLHTGAYAIFYLVALHTGYFLFLHYAQSFHREPPPPNWFRWPFIWIALALLVLQAAAYRKSVVRDRRRTGLDGA